MKLNEREFMELIRAQIGSQSLRSYAKRWGVSAAYLSDVLLGKRNPGRKLAAALGYDVVLVRHPATRTFIKRKKV